MANTNQLIEQIWSTFDSDKSGVLEKKEAQRFIKQICAPGTGLENFTEQIMAMLDEDGDGKLTKEEVLQLFED
jgi:Ca2+-binding EF-hand superfamily protein